MLVRGLYSELLHPGANDRGLTSFTDALQLGIPDDVVIAALVASQEYFNGAQ